MPKLTKRSGKPSVLSVIIPACNKERTIGELVSQLTSWHRRPEVIVVANGCKDSTAKQAKKAGARVILIPEKIGNDVARAIGMDAASGSVYLVLDADRLYALGELEPFVRAVESGVDIALNQYPMPKTSAYQSTESFAKRALNLFLRRPELRAASLSAVPHAVSRRAMRHLGFAAFAVPAVAQARAVLQALQVRAVAHVPNRHSSSARKAHAKEERSLILGDCLEAVSEICRVRGARGGFTDLYRRRSLVKGLKPRLVKDRKRYHVVAVVPVRNEQRTLGRVIKALKAAKIDSICVLSNGSTDSSEAIAKAYGARVVKFRESLGHDVGRAVGCLVNRADYYYFSDGDIPISSSNVVPFIRALGKVDVALNRLDGVIAPGRQTDAVSTVKRFLNAAMNRADLGMASLTGIPHGIRARVIQTIGVDALAVPPLAQVKAVLAGYRVRAVHGVNVVRTNRRRFLYHSKKMGRPLQKLILGDHLEALNYLLRIKGPRGPYPDKVRKRSWIEKWKQMGHK